MQEGGKREEQETSQRNDIAQIRPCVWSMLLSRWTTVPPAHPQCTNEHSGRTGASLPHASPLSLPMLVDCPRAFFDVLLLRLQFHSSSSSLEIQQRAMVDRSRRTGLPRQRQLGDSGSSLHSGACHAYMRGLLNLCHVLSDAVLQQDASVLEEVWKPSEHFPISSSSIDRMTRLLLRTRTTMSKAYLIS
jgi:hypothetical protein